MDKPKAYIDLDHTLTKWQEPFWKTAARRCGIPPETVPTPTEYGIHMYQDELRDEMSHMFEDRWYMCESPTPYLDAADFLARCKRKYYVTIITSRYAHLREGTRRLVDRHFLMLYDDLVLVTPGQGKLVHMSPFAELFVDDNEVECARVARSLLCKVFMPIRPWNADKRIQGVERVYSLEGVKLG